MNTPTKIIGYSFAVIFVAAILSAWVWVFQALWNAVVFGIFKGPSLGYWQAFTVWLFIAAIAGLFRSKSK